MGVCLSSYALFMDARDEFNQKQIYPLGILEHAKYDAPDLSYWYWSYLWNNVTQGGLGCCSDLLIGEHYVTPKRMHFYEYTIYHVQPFGLQKNLTEQLPRKMTLKEILEISDSKTYSPNFINHTIRHNFDSSEVFKK
jgi:hypothetical protein